MSKENTKWILYWDAGYGKHYEISDIGSNKDEAIDEARMSWEEEAENNADYGVMKWTQKREDEYIQ